MEATAAGVGDALRKKVGRRRQETLIEGLLFLCATISIATTFGIIAVLIQETYHFFREVSVVDFLTGTEWAPLFQPQRFGVLPLVCGTFLVAVGSGLVAIPLGLMSGLYMSEYASKRTRAFLKPFLEVLAGIPTVVYGYFAVATVTPFLQKIIPSTQVFNAASASIVVGIMILPTIASLCDDAFQAVPQSLRLGGYALGATRLEVSVRILIPAAISGVLASFVLALSRAIGETMAVTLAAGSTPKMTLNPFESIQTMTAYIVQVSLGDTPAGTISYYTIFAVGMLLFVITLGMNYLSHRILRAYLREYE